MIQHIRELPRRGVAGAFSFGDDAERIVLWLSGKRKPGQFSKQGGELRRLETPGRLRRERVCGAGVLPNNDEERRAGKPDETSLPLHGIGDGFFLVEIDGEVRVIRGGNATGTQKRERNLR